MSLKIADKICRRRAGWKWRELGFSVFLLVALQASNIETKQEWIKNIREVIQERIIHLKGALKEPIQLPKTPAKQRNNSKR